MALKHFLVKSIYQGQQYAAKRLTAQLRRDALEAGWPVQASRHLRVIPSGKGYAVSYPQKHAERIESAEFGTQDTPPNPVVRNFMANLSHTTMTSHVGNSFKRAGLV